MKKNNNFFIEEGIDLLVIISKLLENKVFLIKTSFIFFIIGFLYSLSLNNQYKSTTTFYPHYDNLEENKLQGLAGLAGINLNKQNTINPNLYPQLIKSNDFKNELLNLIIEYNETKISYKRYLLNQKNKFNLNRFIFNNIDYEVNEIINKNDLKYVSKVDNYLFKLLNEKILISINEKDGFIELSAIDYSPEVSTIIAIKANEILQKNIIDFKLKNINDVYQFTNNQLELAKINLYNLQDSIAYFKDNNKSIKSDLFLNKLNRLETEYNISKNIYNQLALEKEKAEIDVKRNTPIFTIINSAYVPFRKHSPNRLLIIVSFSFLGFIISSFWVLFKKQIKSVF